MQDEQFEAALAAAMAVLDHLAARPWLDRPAQLSIATYTILEAMRRLEPGERCPAIVIPFQTASRN